MIEQLKHMHSAMAKKGHCFKFSFWGRDGFFNRMKCTYYSVFNDCVYLYNHKPNGLDMVGILNVENLNAISIEEIEVGNDG